MYGYERVSFTTMTEEKPATVKDGDTKATKTNIVI